MAVVSLSLLLPVPGCNRKQAVSGLIKICCGRLPWIFAILSLQTMQDGRTIDPDTSLLSSSYLCVLWVELQVQSRAAASVFTARCPLHCTSKKTFLLVSCQVKGLKGSNQVVVNSCLLFVVLLCCSSSHAKLAYPWTALQATGQLRPWHDSVFGPPYINVTRLSASDHMKQAYRWCLYRLAPIHCRLILLESSNQSVSSQVMQLPWFDLICAEHRRRNSRYATRNPTVF